MFRDPGLIPVDIKEQAILSIKQREELLGIARIYLRRQQIPIENVGVVHKALGVLGDALNRGLKAEGRQVAGEKERLRPLVEKGLENRELVKKQATEVIDLSNKNLCSHPDLVGPLALFPELLKEAQRELRNFPLSKLRASDALIDLSEKRVEIIDRLCRVAISHLPEELRNVSLEKFPELSDRSKLLRNMIASYVFRSSLSPLITTLDLKDFAKKVNSVKFSEEEKSLLIEELALESSDEKLFVSNLFDQTARAFPSIVSVLNENNPDQIDKFYRDFSNTLLLLHPALEEEQIVVSQRTLSEGAFSLWTNGVVIGNATIPSPEMLVQSQRQAKAKGNTPVEERLSKGFRVWRLYEQEKINHALKIQKAQEQLSESEKLSEDLVNPLFPLPKEAYLEYTEAHSKVRKKERALKNVARIMEKHNFKQERVDEYESWLRETYGDEFPDRVEIPSWICKEELEEQRSRVQGKIREINKKLTIVEDLLGIDFIFGANSAIGVLIKEPAKKWVKKEQTRIKDLEGERDLLEKFINWKNLQEASEHYWIPGGFRLSSSSLTLREYYSFWKNLLKGFYKRNKKNPELAQSSFLSHIPQIAMQRKELLSYIDPLLLEREELTKKHKEIKEKIAEEEEGNTIVGSEKWSREEALSCIDEVRASEMPEMEGVDVKEFTKLIKGMRDFTRKAFVSIFPSEIGGRKAFSIWLQANISQIRNKLINPEEPFKVRRTGAYSKTTNLLRKKIDLSEELACFIEHPLLPFPQEGTLPRDKFLRIWQRRTDYVYALIYQKKTEDQYAKAQKDYETISRFVFREKLVREINAKRNYLNSLETKNLEAELAERMRNLNLVLEINS